MYVLRRLLRTAGGRNLIRIFREKKNNQITHQWKNVRTFLVAKVGLVDLLATPKFRHETVIYGSSEKLHIPTVPTRHTSTVPTHIHSYVSACLPVRNKKSNERIKFMGVSCKCHFLMHNFLDVRNARRLRQ